MANSPALRARERALARRAAASAEHGQDVVGDAHELLMAQLVEHRRSLKALQSVERKVAAKRTYLPAYDQWIDTTLAVGNGGRDPIITTLLIWHIDCGLFGRALAIANYCMRHGMELPDQYERSMAVALIDEFSGAYLRGAMPADAASAELLQAVDLLTCEHDAPDQARAKLVKAIGYALIGRGAKSPDVDLDALPREQLTSAISYLERAFQLWDQVGVKKDLERMHRRLRQLDAEAGGSGSGTGSSTGSSTGTGPATGATAGTTPAVNPTPQVDSGSTPPPST